MDQATETISAAESTYDYLLGRLDAIWNTYGADNTGKGTAFERLIAGYLRTAPEFADRFGDVYLWQEWPERGNQHDHGIDIVARDIDNGGWCAVQCKFYDPQHHVAKADIDSFIAASARSKFTGRIIVSTAKDWGPTAEKQLDGLAVPVVRIGIADLLESKVDWSQINWNAPQTILPTTGKKVLRNHQSAALAAVRDGLGIQDRGQLVMACGTGKTFTALKIAEDLATSRKAEPTNVLFLVPSIQLLNQTLREWKQESEIPFRAFAVCSDTKVGKGTEDLKVHDLILPATTDTAALAKAVKQRSKDDQFTVVFSTYQSIDVVAQAQQAGMPDFDLIVCDEAHRTTGVTLAGEEESSFVRVHDNTYLRGAKRLYMTATPRLFDPNVRDRAKANDAVLTSMDDETLFGPALHRLGFGEAVERDLLTDYKVLVLTVSEDMVSATFQQEMSTHQELKLSDASKLIGCWNGLAKRFGSQTPEGMEGLDLSPMRRAVAFAPSIKSSKLVEAAYPALVDRLRSQDEVEESNALGIEVRHVDGTMNALERGNLLQWLKDGAPEDETVCRLLTNARCLSEGVDVPALDAVLFLSPRGSQVDIVQSVGRVMRKDPAGVKQMGYIVLPVVIPSGSTPEAALDDNDAFRVVWQILQALRAHDDRFAAMVNKLDLNKKKTDKILVFDTGQRGKETVEITQLALPLDFEKFKDAIYAKIVTKVGERRYWETWANSVAEIAGQHIARINGLLSDENSAASQEFAAFLEGLRGNLNDGISRDDAIEMLAQHLITAPVFNALFGGYDFIAHNPVAQTMQRMLDVLDEAGLEGENSELDRFYESVHLRLADIDNSAGRQKILTDLYDNFFAKAFKRRVEKLGIVYTPIEIVDFILRSADWALREHFSQSISDEGVHVLDGFTGTGTFIVRLLQLGLIAPHDLARKYANELHANEILLLAYYIAAVNIETTYQDLMREQAATPEARQAVGYEPFPGLVLTDTFQSYEDGDEDDLAVFPQNNERINRQRSLPITVIVGNPPYSAGQESANDNNQNDPYPSLDKSIRDSYAAESTARLKNKLYDSYIRSIRWASLRLGSAGVIAFVTNAGYLESTAADGLRRVLAREFDVVLVLNLKGNMRASEWKREGGQIFGAGSQAAVAITLLIRGSRSAAEKGVFYTDIGDFLDRKEKLERLSAWGSSQGVPWNRVTPNAAADWVNPRSEDFAQFSDLRDLFEASGNGVNSGRDAWVYGNSRESVLDRMERTIAHYNAVISHADVDGTIADNDDTRISWSRNLVQAATARRATRLTPDAMIQASYRPFCRKWLYSDRVWNSVQGKAPRLFAALGGRNIGLMVMAPRAEALPAVLMVGATPDLSFYTYTAQFFTRWLQETVHTDEGMLSLAAYPDGIEIVDGYRRIDNITDHALTTFRAAYGDAITKDDIFFYVYGLLHSPEYRETYAADLKKMLPRIPLVADPWPFVKAGRALSDLHLGYESVTPYPLDGLEVEGPAGDAAYDFFSVDKKMRFATKGDRSRIVYNSHITLGGIPEEAYRYMLGSRSAVEWIMDRYWVKTDKASGIVNEPNDWSREVSDPRYIIDLLARIVTVSLETMAIVDGLPALDIRADQSPKGK